MAYVYIMQAYITVLYKGSKFHIFRHILYLVSKPDEIN